MAKRSQIECAELERLSSENAELYKAYLSAKDQLNMTAKTTPGYSEYRLQLKSAQGQLRHGHKRWQKHIKDHGCR